LGSCASGKNWPKGLPKLIKKSYLLCIPFLIFSFSVESSTARETDVLPETRAAVVSRVNELIVEQYVFVDVAEKIKNTLARKFENGEYDRFDTGPEFAMALERDVQEVSQDQHLRIQFNPAEAAKLIASDTPTSEEAEELRQQDYEFWRQKNFGISAVRRLWGNIGYLDLRHFSPIELNTETVTGSMNVLAGTDAVIIDLRQNGGGDPKMVQFISSYFIREMTHLNTLVHSHQENPEEEYWTLPYVPGMTMYDKDLYILTSRFTFSAGEEFAYNMKNLKRATIIGQVTRGGAHDGGKVPVLDLFVMNLPNGRAVNPITKTNWEGVGVQPDIVVAERDAAFTAQKLILEKFITDDVKGEKKEFYRFALREITAQLSPKVVIPRILQEYAGNWPRQIEILYENGQLVFVEGESSYDLIPISETLFYVDGADDYQIDFELKQDGSVANLVKAWENGFRSDYGPPIKD
jgi:hypothetical protein